MRERSCGILKRDVDIIVNNIGDLIRNTRTAKNISMAQLAKMYNLSSSLISDLENHKGKTPNIYTLVAIARALDIPDGTFIEKIWQNVNIHNKEISDDNKLRTALLDYGVPEQYVKNIMDYATFLASISKVELNSKVIVEHYNKRINSDNYGFDFVKIDEDIFKACVDNLLTIAELKKNLQ